MSGLLKKYNDYLKITTCKMHYEFQSGFVLEFRFVKSGFLHLIGMHKLNDIPLIQKFNSKKVSANYVISKIKNTTLTEAVIKSSKYFPQIQKRYDEFTSENLFTLAYTDVIIDFDIKKLEQSKLVNTKFILFEAEKQNGYRQLCIAGNEQSGFYPETYFFQPNDYYIKSQLCEKIKKVQMIQTDGSILFEDEF